MPEMLMPKLSDTMEEGTILRWMKADGDMVAKGEPLVEIETDKATMTVEAPANGVLMILAQEGDTLDIGVPIAAIGEATAPPTAPGGPAEQPVITEIPMTDDGTGHVIAAAPHVSTHDADERIKASPLARNIAARADLDLAAVTGTGPGGRIVAHDVEAALGGDAPPPPPVAPTTPTAERAAPVPPRVPTSIPTSDWPAGRRTPLTKLQTTIARRMAEAHAVPDFTLERDVDTTALAAARADLRVALPEDQRPSLNDMVVRAVAIAVRERPDMASRLEGNELVVPDGVDVGVAVSIPGGLIVPVLRGADRKTVPQIAAEVRDLVRRGRAGELRPDELEGSAISVTNLGMFGIDRFHAVINVPESAILAVGRAMERPVVVDGHVVVRDVMTLSLSADHRVVYGAEAATFLGRVAELLEHPAALLV